MIVLKCSLFSFEMQTLMLLYECYYAFVPECCDAFQAEERATQAEARRVAEASQVRPVAPGLTMGGSPVEQGAEDRAPTSEARPAEQV